MNLRPLKKLVLGSALALAAAFNMISCRATRDVATAPAPSLQTDSIHKKYNTRGELVGLERYRGGLLNDGPNGEPAYIELGQDGAVTAVERYANGQLNDGPNGEPAVTDFYNSGLPSHIEYYKHDVIDDGINGDPAFQDFDFEGKLVMAFRYRNGAMTKIMTAQERAAYQAKAHPELKKAPAVPAAFRHFSK